MNYGGGIPVTVVTPLVHVTALGIWLILKESVQYCAFVCSSLYKLIENTIN